MGTTNNIKLQLLSETIANVVDLDVEIIDCQLRRLAATGTMERNIGTVMGSGWLNKKVLDTGKNVVVTRPGNDLVCEGCQMKNHCIYQVGMLVPIFLDAQTVGVINLVGFSNKQCRTFKAKQETYQKFLSILGNLIMIDILSIAEPFKVERVVAGIIENIQKGLITIEDEGRISYISDRAKAIMGKHKLFQDMNIYGDPTQHIIRRKKSEDLIGSSSALDLVKYQIMKLANQDTSVMIQGESGTGKELVARIIHDQGKRRQYPFVDINCAALPDNLVESELFGYIDGAYTGARKGGSVGKIEYANKGTLFLDEIGDMPLSVQAKLLRVLEEREIYRIGSNKPVSVDMRIIAATNKNLTEIVQKGQFRQDLYYRINVATIILPRLSERKEDIPELVRYYIKHFSALSGKKELIVDKKLMEVFINYDWKGNIRELRNVIEYCMIFTKADTIKTDSLPQWFKEVFKEQECLNECKDNAERQVLLEAYKKYGSDKAQMARALNIGLTTLYRKLNKYRIDSAVITNDTKT